MFVKGRNMQLENIVTCIPVAMERLGKQARNKYATNNTVDPLLGTSLWSMDIFAYYRLEFESTRISAVSSAVLVEVSRVFPPFKCLNSNKIRTRQRPSKSFPIHCSPFDAIQPYILTKSPLSSGFVRHDTNMTDVRSSEMGTTSAFLTWDPKIMYGNLSIYSSTVLVDLDRFFSFLIYTQSVGLLGRGISPSHRTTQTQNDSNQRFQCSSGRRRFMPSTERTVWSAMNASLLR
jgi:hypothetical protein